MREIIIQRLREEWSPEQIHGRCKADNIDMVSHERIYQSASWRMIKKMGVTYIGI